jgi:hypothetical protein
MGVPVRSGVIVGVGVSGAEAEVKVKRAATVCTDWVKIAAASSAVVVGLDPQAWNSIEINNNPMIL